MMNQRVEEAVETSLQLQREGKVFEAEEACRAALNEHPDHPNALRRMAVLLSQSGRSADGLRAIRKAVEVKNDDADLHYCLATLLAQARRREEAIQSFQRTLDIRPSYFDAMIQLAGLLLDEGRWEEAIAYSRRAIGIAPRMTGPYGLLGAAMQMGRRNNEAMAASLLALSLDPNCCQAMANLGNTMMAMGRIDKAIEIGREIVAKHPNYAVGWNNLANALERTAKTGEALQALLTAVKIDPGLADGHNNLGNVYKNLAIMDAARDAYRKAIALSPTTPMFRSNLIYVMWFCQDCEASDVYLESVRWSDILAASLTRQAAPHLNDRTANRRIKVGYVSPDFRGHPVGRLVSPLLANHDRSQFEIVLFSGVNHPDAMTRQIYSYADEVIATRDMSDEELAERIRQENIDILVDLNLHMGGSRLMAFARKPAPVQITYLAYCATSGMKAMDYCVTDSHLDPLPLGCAEQDTQSPVHSERLLRLSNCYWCYTTPAEAPPVNPLPALERGSPTFGSFNTFAKINRNVIWVWSRLLRSIPGSRLVIVIPDKAERRREIANLFAEQGVAANRLMMATVTPLPIYFRLFHEVDLALDPFPYNGGTTTMDALYMGVPVVSLAGRWATARAGVTLLNHVGFPDWIAQDADQYIQIATDLTRDYTRLAEIRRTLRKRMTDSPLMNGRSLATDMEAAYRRAWIRWCNTEGQAN